MSWRDALLNGLDASVNPHHNVDGWELVEFDSQQETMPEDLDLYRYSHPDEGQVVVYRPKTWTNPAEVPRRTRGPFRVPPPMKFLPHERRR